MNEESPIHTWRMFAGHVSDGPDGPWWRSITDSRRATSLYGEEDIRPVIATADPNGAYAGWIKTGDTRLVMMQVHQIFSIQFPYGVQAEVDAGRGRAVRLRITELDLEDGSDG